MTKTNIAAPAPAMAYHLELDTDAHVPRVVWEGETQHTADALLAARLDGEERSALDEAKAFLRDVLAGGPVPAKEMARQATEAGIAAITLRRARKALEVEVRKVGGRYGAADKQRWEWSMPEGVGAAGWAHNKDAETYTTAEPRDS
jgi:hypothetical protein